MEAVMDFPEEPRPARDPRTPDSHGPRPPRGEHETEAWLRRELAFLYGVERKILRRTRIRKEAWRAAAVAAILAMFAACWYLAAVSSNSLSSSSDACATKTATSSSASSQSSHLTGGSSAAAAKSTRACSS
ncbi:hypothetical protein KDK95_24305 [Actinospica sp. MGRD01-02]|uniref:Uncharacterized protein n=1 Tax=Actinospica acidithermotolerans TaxID=2828514 RepID=A0A941INF5_9ACTN|nr:hypothetical protein [Actinospica acidithermotolerans]MBR7829451.1 hypothetical protein [Actinospica acidithermotolerans]